MKISRTLGSLTMLAGTALLVPGVEGSLEFVAMLPNGGNVPDTPAIGHPDGTGDSAATNAFGDAFADAGHKWTKELCEADTDGDGQTNGQELGDPCCEWDMDTNNVVQWTDGVSHPDDASKTSDSSLWANIVCDSSSSSTAGNSTESSSSELTATSGTSSSTGATSSSKTPATTAPSASSTSDASAAHPVFVTAAGIIAVVALNLA